MTPCWRCGFSPVRLEVTGANGKQFAYACPNEECEDGWKSPRAEMWKPSRTEAASEWDAANAPCPYRRRDRVAVPAPAGGQKQLAPGTVPA